jgi:hypothetical protein
LVMVIRDGDRFEQEIIEPVNFVPFLTGTVK